MRVFHNLRSEPLMRKRGALASLSPEARDKLNAIIGAGSTRRAAKLLKASDATLAILREPYGTATPETIERLTRTIEEATGLG